MAVCSRPDGPAIDLFGPIFRVSQWPGLWWNLNVQLTYWPFYTSNHLNLSGNLIDLIDKQFESLLKSFRGPKLGDFGWVMHNYWLQYRYLGDWKSIQDKWVPKAMKIVAAYEELQHRNAKGKLNCYRWGHPNTMDLLFSQIQITTLPFYIGCLIHSLNQMKNLMPINRNS